MHEMGSGRNEVESGRSEVGNGRIEEKSGMSEVGSGRSEMELANLREKWDERGGKWEE